jgi:hypothetical protein
LPLHKLTDRASTPGAAIFTEEQSLAMQWTVILARQEPSGIYAGFVHQRGYHIDNHHAIDRSLTRVEKPREIERGNLERVSGNTKRATRLPRYDGPNALRYGFDRQVLTTAQKHRYLPPLAIPSNRIIESQIECSEPRNSPFFPPRYAKCNL